MTDLPITEPGIYDDIDIEDYHSQCCDGPSVSSFGLRTILEQSELHFYSGWSGNPNAEPRNTDAFSFGSAAHALLLGDEAFERRHVVSKYPDFRTKEAKAWKAEQEEAGKRIIKQEQLAQIFAMRDALAKEPLVQAGILEGGVEQSLFWKDEETGVWLKARPDGLPKDGWMMDLKSTVSSHPRKIQRSIYNYRYDMQLALAAEGMAALGLEVPNSFALIFQEKTAPYAVTAQPIPLSAIEAGARSNRIAIRRFAQCLAEDTWPGYGEAEDIYVPEFIYDRIQGSKTPEWVEQIEEPA